MKTVKISLNSIDKVKSFVNDITKFDVDFDLVSGRYVIDAKSIMGIFSLDLSKPIDLNIHADNDIDMLEYAGCGIAMENASNGLRAVADAVTLHHDRDGVAYALKNILKCID